MAKVLLWIFLPFHGLRVEATDWKRRPTHPKTFARNSECNNWQDISLEDRKSQPDETQCHWPLPQPISLSSLLYSSSNIFSNIFAKVKKWNGCCTKTFCHQPTNVPQNPSEDKIRVVLFVLCTTPEINAAAGLWPGRDFGRVQSICLLPLCWPLSFPTGVSAGVHQRLRKLSF